MRANNVAAGIAEARRREPVGAPVIIERTGEEGTIYRINGLNPVRSQTSMELVYDMPRPVYFLNTLVGQNVHIREYITKSGPYIKTFRLKPGQVLRLIDMSQLATRTWVASMMSAVEVESLDHSFPLGDGIVRRVSGEEQEAHDLIVMIAICEILARHPVADGYYSAPQPGGFHAEIGLCPSAFPKFVHVNTTVGKVEGPPRLAGHKRPGTRRNNRRNNLAAAANNNLASPPRPMRMRLAMNNTPVRGSLFGLNNATPVRKSLFGSSRKLRTRRQHTRRRT